MSLERSRMRARNLALAMELIDGRSAAAAYRKVGYSASTAAKKGYKIIQRPGVRQAIIELGQLVAEGCKPHARARLLRTVQDSTVSLPALILAVRQAADETCAYRSLKQHLADCQQPAQQEIPPQLQQLLAKRVAELLKEREQTHASDQEPLPQ